MLVTTHTILLLSMELCPLCQVQCPHPSPRAPCAPRVSGPGRASVLTPSVATGEGSSVDTGNRTQQAGA